MASSSSARLPRRPVLTSREGTCETLHHLRPHEAEVMPRIICIMVCNSGVQRQEGGQGASQVQLSRSS